MRPNVGDASLAPMPNLPRNEGSSPYRPRIRGGAVIDDRPASAEIRESEAERWRPRDGRETQLWKHSWKHSCGHPPDRVSPPIADTHRPVEVVQGGGSGHPSTANRGGHLWTPIDRQPSADGSGWMFQDGGSGHPSTAGRVRPTCLSPDRPRGLRPGRLRSRSRRRRSWSRRPPLVPRSRTGRTSPAHVGTPHARPRPSR